MIGYSEDTYFDQLFDEIDPRTTYCPFCKKSLNSSEMAVPQAAFAAKKVRINEDKRKQFECNSDLSPTNYSSKFMDSIWGQYNRYSVHNLKKIMDNKLFPNFGMQNEKSLLIPQVADKPLFPANIGNIGSKRSFNLPIPINTQEPFLKISSKIEYK